MPSVETSLHVGAVVGRFQVPDLTMGHRFLIETALRNHRRVIVLIGSPDKYGTARNPLDYQTRVAMILGAFPQVVAIPAIDFPGKDKLWAKHLDKSIEAVFPGADRVTIYAGRDSFEPHYVEHGKHQVSVVDSGCEHVSGTETRRGVGKTPLNSVAFRRGVIYSTQNPPPTSGVAPDAFVVRGGRDIA